MNKRAKELEPLLSRSNVRAFLLAIRRGEGTGGVDGYRTLFGGELFDSFDKHPGKKITKRHGGKPITSTAAGAYQFLQATWDECQEQLELPDFGPTSQDIAALFLIWRRKALDDVLDGKIGAAIRKCNREWASLPGSPYGQPVVSMADAVTTYLENGGDLA